MTLAAASDVWLRRGGFEEGIASLFLTTAARPTRSHHLHPPCRRLRPHLAVGRYHFRFMRPPSVRKGHEGLKLWTRQRRNPMDPAIDRFLSYLAVERGLSGNTGGGLQQRPCSNKGVSAGGGSHRWEELTREHISAFLMKIGGGFQNGAEHGTWPRCARFESPAGVGGDSAESAVRVPLSQVPVEPPRSSLQRRWKLFCSSPIPP